MKNLNTNMLTSMLIFGLEKGRQKVCFGNQTYKLPLPQRSGTITQQNDYILQWRERILSGKFKVNHSGYLLPR